MPKLLVRLREVAAGLAYIHARNVLHGDLKAANVLLASAPGAPFGQIAKVSDFGLSRAVAPGATHASTHTMGTVTHMPPELLRLGKLSPAADVYAFGILVRLRASFLFAVRLVPFCASCALVGKKEGCCASCFSHSQQSHARRAKQTPPPPSNKPKQMWELYAGEPAFSGQPYGQVFERVVLRGERPPIPAGMPAPYALLMARCWAADSAARPGFEAVLQCLQLMLDEGDGGSGDGEGGAGGGGGGDAEAAAAFVHDLV
jgi:serine/threonine protein kinase